MVAQDSDFTYLYYMGKQLIVEISIKVSEGLSNIYNRFVVSTELLTTLKVNTISVK